MADFAIGVDGYTPAVVTLATRWFWADALGLEWPMNADSRPTAVSGTLNVPFDPYELGANLWTLSSVDAGAPIYKMRGMDALTNGVYGTWLSYGEPDAAGLHYAGPLHTPLRDIVVIDSWLSA